MPTILCSFSPVRLVVNAAKGATVIELRSRAMSSSHWNSWVENIVEKNFAAGISSIGPFTSLIALMMIYKTKATMQIGDSERVVTPTACLGFDHDII